MISTRTKNRLWRAGSIVVFCGLPLLLLGHVTSNVMEAMKLSDQAAQTRAVTSKILAQVLKRHAHPAAPVDIASLYLTSATDSRARAEVQVLVSTLVAQADGRLDEVQSNTTQEQEAAGVVALQVTLDIDNKGLLHLLYDIESNMPLLEVADLSAQNNVGSEDRQRGDRALHVDIAIQGHWRHNTE